MYICNNEYYCTDNLFTQGIMGISVYNNTGENVIVIPRSWRGLSSLEGYCSGLFRAQNGKEIKYACPGIKTLAPTDNPIFNFETSGHCKGFAISSVDDQNNWHYYTIPKDYQGGTLFIREMLQNSQLSDPISSVGCPF